jgi:hypothetical protein
MGPVNIPGTNIIKGAGFTRGRNRIQQNTITATHIMMVQGQARKGSTPWEQKEKANRQ